MQRVVDEALGLGAHHLDVGQLPEEGHIVLADPEGNELCVIPPDSSFLAGTGFLGELACDGSRDVGVFWSEALGWPLVWDEDEETAVQSPAGWDEGRVGRPAVGPQALDEPPAPAARPRATTTRRRWPGCSSLGATRVDDWDTERGRGWRHDAGRPRRQRAAPPAVIATPAGRPQPGAPLRLPAGPGLRDGLVIDPGELVERFSRSSGPGGQGVNTTDSRVELDFDPSTSRAVAALPEATRQRLLDRLAPSPRRRPADRRRLGAPVPAPEPGGGPAATRQAAARGGRPRSADPSPHPADQGLPAPPGRRQEAPGPAQVRAPPTGDDDARADNWRQGSRTTANRSRLASSASPMTKSAAVTDSTTARTPASQTPGPGPAGRRRSTRATPPTSQALAVSQSDDPDVGAGQPPAQLGAELHRVVLATVVEVGGSLAPTQAGGEGEPVRRGDDQDAAGPGDAGQLAHVVAGRPDVLEHLEGHRHVDRAVVERERRQRTPQVCRLLATVGPRGVRGGHRVVVDADHADARPGVGEEARGIPLAAAGVEDDAGARTAPSRARRHTPPRGAGTSSSPRPHRARCARP